MRRRLGSRHPPTSGVGHGTAPSRAGGLLREHNAEPLSSSLPEARAGGWRVPCPGTSDGTVETAVLPIPADAALTERHVFQLRLRPGDPVPAIATVRVPQVNVLPSRAGTDGAAVDAFAADPRLAGWLDDSRSSGTTGWTTALAWWRGAWELRVHPASLPGSGCGFLRMRHEPAAASVVDVRQVPAPRCRRTPCRVPAAGEQDDVVYP